jgi:hypothetical protein
MPSFGTCFGKRRAVGIPTIGIAAVLPGDRSALIISVWLIGQTDMLVVSCLGTLVGLCMVLSLFDEPQSKR